MKKIILALVVLIVFVTGGCSLIQRQQQLATGFSLEAQPASFALPRGSLKSAVSQAPISVGNADVFAVMQNIAKDNRAERTITWQSKLPRSSSFLEYREQGHTDILKVKASQNEFVTDQGKKYQHIISINGLKADHSYEYRINDGEDYTAWETFHTDNGVRTKALIFPDSQSVDYGLWARTVRMAWGKNPDAQFFINMGDLVDNGEQYWQWARWLEAVDGMIEKIPLAPISGNHEDYTLDWKMTEPHTYLNLFTLPTNEIEGFNEYFYSYDYGDVHFIVIDTQKDELAEFKPDLFAKELAWAEKDLASTNKPWKVVLMHKHIFNFRVDGSYNDIGNAFMPLFDKYKVDVVFTGHIHSYRRTVPLYEGVAAEKGTIYISTGVAGERLRLNGPAQISLEAAINPQPALPNYLVLETNTGEMKIQAFTQKGDMIDSVVLKK